MWWTITHPLVAETDALPAGARVEVYRVALAISPPAHNTVSGHKSVTYFPSPHVSRFRHGPERGRHELVAIGEDDRDGHDWGLGPARVLLDAEVDVVAVHAVVEVRFLKAATATVTTHARPFAVR
jgi:hypothetical protein